MLRKPWDRIRCVIGGRASGIMLNVRRMLQAFSQVHLICLLLMSYGWMDVEVIPKLLSCQGFLTGLLKFSRLLIEKGIKILVLVHVIGKDED